MNEIIYNKVREFESVKNKKIIGFLDGILNHRVNETVWNWEFNSLGNTVFAIAESDNLIIGTQSMLPIKLVINGQIIVTSKSETSYLNTDYRGKKIFEKLYQLAVDETVEFGSKIIWGFTPAIKAWKNNLGFETFESEMCMASLKSKYFSFRKNSKFSKNFIFALGRYILNNFKIIRFKLKMTYELKYDPSIAVLKEKKKQDDIFLFYKQLSEQNPDFIHLDLNEEYLKWRIEGNPELVYKKYFFYKANVLVGYTYFSVKGDVLSFADISYNGDSNILNHIFKYVINHTQGFHLVQYWGNVSHDLNKSIFNLFKNLYGTSKIDKSRNFVYKIFYPDFEEKTSKLSNWYINGMWTEGFHI